MGWKEFKANLNYIFNPSIPSFNKGMTGKGRLSKSKQRAARTKARATINKVSRVATAGFRYQMKKRGMARMARPARWF